MANAKLYGPAAYNGLFSEGDNSVAVAGGKLYMYEPGTTNLKDGYTDADKGSTTANPFILDGNGKGQVWLDGNYRLVLHTSADVEVWDNDGDNFRADVFPGGTFTGAALFTDGSVTAPGIGFADDTNTGIYRIGSDNLGVTAGGTKIIDVATTGVAVTGTLSATGAATITGALTVGGLLAGSATAAITASTTQSQGQGALTTDINEITVVGTASDTVTLPTAVPGYRVTVINNDSADILQIFPASGDDLGNGVDTAGLLGNGDSVTFIAITATTWMVEGGFITRVVEIGDWNMDSTATLNVAHGLTLAKIRDIAVMIRDDADAAWTLFGLRDSSGAPDGEISSITATNVSLGRAASGLYDATTHDSTSFNRGYLTIRYII